MRRLRSLTSSCYDRHSTKSHLSNAASANRPACARCHGQNDVLRIVDQRAERASSAATAIVELDPTYRYASQQVLHSCFPTSVNPLMGTGNYSATLNNMKLVHRPTDFKLVCDGDAENARNENARHENARHMIKREKDNAGKVNSPC